MMGRPKASVLPDPVGERTRTSRPEDATGSTSSWTGNGVVMPVNASTADTRSLTPRSAKVVGFKCTCSLRTMPRLGRETAIRPSAAVFPERATLSPADDPMPSAPGTSGLPLRDPAAARLPRRRTRPVDHRRFWGGRIPVSDSRPRSQTGSSPPSWERRRTPVSSSVPTRAAARPCRAEALGEGGGIAHQQESVRGEGHQPAVERHAGGDGQRSDVERTAQAARALAQLQQRAGDARHRDVAGRPGLSRLGHVGQEREVRSGPLPAAAAQVAEERPARAHHGLPVEADHQGHLLPGAGVPRGRGARGPARPRRWTATA